ncbi:protein kinase [Streptomyces sp. NPDC127098]|uniref:serine/threonine-protein kinase n=1 Tax=Streptomyces sp. NPDC127098 TaxID=3347137 RepID=UPI00364B137C
MPGGEPGQVIDARFELRERLGRGGMGTVWRAMDLALHREVAIKEVRPPEDAAPATEAMLRERALREARALARLNHPNVVRIYHIVDLQPHPWLVMELLPGDTLASRVAAGPLPWGEVIRYGRDVLAALRAAHEAGIHHRDVKPANVLLRQDGSAVLTDFGIAAVADGGSLTMTGGIVGSPEFIAPERLRGAPDHPAADLWSLGITLYLLAEGVSPLRRASTVNTLAAVLEDPVPPPVRSGPLGDVLSALLVRDPAARPTAAHLDAMLAMAAQQAAAAPAWQPAATPETRPTRVSPPPPGSTGAGRSRTALVAGLTAGAVLLAGGLTAALLLGGGSDATADPDPTVGGEPTDREVDPVPPSPATPEGSTPSPGEPTTEPTLEPTEEPTTDEPEDDPADGGAGADAGFWMAQLFSEPVESGPEVRDQRLAAVRAEGMPEAEVVLSDDFASLNPGYWVIYAPGPFSDGRDALAFCADRGRTTSNQCMGRYLSTEPDDRVYICQPGDDGPSGRCERE